MLLNDKTELDRFKREINLVEFARYHGFEIDMRASYRTGTILRQGGYKILVGIGEDNHYLFRELKGSGAAGSIVDFCSSFLDLNIGQARKACRDYMGLPAPSFPAPEKHFHKPKKTHKDIFKLMAEWETMKSYDGGYLESRGLKDETIAAFSHHMKMDENRNVCFRHDDANGLSGWETKNQGFTGFSGGGKKALFMCNTYPDHTEPQRIVIAEAAIDAMSYAQLSEKPGLYVSISGTPSPEQKAQLTALLQKYSKAHVVVATDADAQGENYAVFINDICQDRPSELFHRVRPRSKSQPGEYFKDWNDVVRNRPSPRPQAQSAADIERSHNVTQEPTLSQTPADRNADRALSPRR